MRRRVGLAGIAALAAAALAISSWLFTREARLPPTPTLSPTTVPVERGNLIAFESNRDGNAEVYVMGVDGTQPKNVTNDPADDYSPEWSPEGRELAFISDRSGKTEVYVVAADGTNLRQLTDDPEANWGGVRVEGNWLQVSGRGNLSWSPDGTRLAVTRVLINPTDAGWNEAQIYAVNTDGSGSALLTDSEGRGNDFSPFWAPAGEFAALAQVLHMFQLSQGDFRRPAFAGVGLGNGIAQQLRVRVPGMHQHLFHRSHFNNVAAEHDGDPVADVVGRRQVMRDIEDAHAQFIPKLLEQIDN